MDDKSTRRSLAHFGPDFLSGIVFYLDGFDIAMLWFTGNQILRQLLVSKHVVRRFWTNFESRRLVLKLGFPGLVSHFTDLESLSLSENRYSEPSVPHFNLEGLPGTLKELLLDGISVSPLLPLLEGGSVHFNHLQKLKAVTSTHIWTTKELKLLPASIEDLEISELQNASLIDQSILPSKLKHFSIKFLQVEDLNPLENPPQLQTLHITLRGTLDQKDASIGPFLRHLPASLESLHLIGAIRLDGCFENLPNGLRALEIGTVNLKTFSAWKKTVPHLTSLSLRSSNHLPFSIFSTLPDCLTYADISPFDGLNLDTANPFLSLEFPPALTFVEWAHWRPYKLAQLAPMLPPKLINLRNMKYFTDSTLIPLLPRSITSLTIPALTKNMVDLLPPHLTELNAQKGILNNSDVLRLPPSITVLQLEQAEKVHFTILCEHFPLRVLWKGFTDSPKATILYRSLLNLSRCPTLTELKMEDVNFETEVQDESLWPELLSSMPHLSALTLVANAPNRITMSLLDPNIMESLPSSLTELRLENLRGPFTDHHMKVLPRKLKTIKILNPTSNELTDQGIPHWPLHVCQMTLPANPQHLTPQGLSQIPERLNYAIRFGSIFLPTWVTQCLVHRSSLH